MEVQRELESDRRRMDILAQQTVDERQHLEELRRRMDEERQSAEASARQAADKEKRDLLRPSEQLNKDRGALMDEREEQRRHWEERWRLLQYDEDVLSKAFVQLGQWREESKVSGAAR